MKARKPVLTGLKPMIIAVVYVGIRPSCNHQKNPNK